MSNSSLRVLCLVFFSVALPGVSSIKAAGTFATYTFDVPPDIVFTTVSPQLPVLTGRLGWPEQVLDAEKGFELREGVEFHNWLLNTLFFDGNSVILQNSSLMNGRFAWADARSNLPGIETPPWVLIDFTNRVGQIPQNVSFDIAIAVDVSVLGAIITDSLGTETTIAPDNIESFVYGAGLGTQAHYNITPVDGLVDIATVRLNVGTGELPFLPVGFDNLTFDGGVDADLSGDSQVDGEDLEIWSDNFGTSDNGDIDGDSDTDGADFLFWQKRVEINGSGLTGGSSRSVIEVPEPNAMACALTTSIAVLWRKVWRRPVFRE